DAVRREPELDGLVSDRVRGVIRSDGIRGAIAKRRTTGGRVLRRAERRVDLGRRVIRGFAERGIDPRIAPLAIRVEGLPGPPPGPRDPLVRQRQVVWRHVARDRETTSL